MREGLFLKDGGANIAPCTGACALTHEPAAAIDFGRRAFLSHGAAAVALLALAACGLSADPTSPSTLAATSISLSDHAALNTVGGVAVLSISGTPVAVVRESASSFSAFSLICPHAGNTVQVTSTKTFFCPGHGAEFSLTGQWTGGQRTSNLVSYPTQFDATAGTVTIGA